MTTSNAMLHLKSWHFSIVTLLVIGESGICNKVPFHRKCCAHLDPSSQSGLHDENTCSPCSASHLHDSSSDGPHQASPSHEIKMATRCLVGHIAPNRPSLTRQSATARLRKTTSMSSQGSNCSSARALKQCRGCPPPHSPTSPLCHWTGSSTPTERSRAFKHWVISACGCGQPPTRPSPCLPSRTLLSIRRIQSSPQPTAIQARSQCALSLLACMR